MHCSWSSLNGDPSRALTVLPVPASEVLFVHRGRVAVWWAARQMGLGVGDEILVPSYHCGSEVDPLVRLGIAPRAYEVEADLSINLQHLAAAVTPRTRAVYVIHYFGFVHDLAGLARWCRERSLRLIEDCALALFADHGGVPAGMTGDAGIFSFRKTLPVPDGGALILKGRRPPTNLELKVPPARAIRFELGRLFGRWARGHLPPWIRVRHVRTAARRAGAVDVRGEGLLPLAAEDRFDQQSASWTMSQASMRICGAATPATVKKRRRDNFERLGQQLAEVPGVRPIWTKLVDGACPVAFPIRCDERNALYRYLLACNIAAIPWWAGFHESVDWNTVPVGRTLKQSVVALPVHQGLETRHMDYIADCVRAFARRRVVSMEPDVIAAAW